MARKADVSAEETGRQIVDAAFMLFGRYGYDGVSVDQIARKSGLSKGAMYWHYRGKDDLFVACLDKLHGLFMQHIFDPLENIENANIAIGRFFQGLANLLQEPEIKRGIAGFWLAPSRADLERIALVRKEFEDHTANIIAGIFERGAAAGELNIQSDPKVMSRAMIAVMEAAVLPLRQHTAEENAETLAILMETFFRAYGASAS